MKILNFKNRDIEVIANFLGNLTLKNTASRGRTKLISMLSEKNEERTADIKEVVDRYGKRDGGDVVQSTPDGNVAWQDGKENEALNEVADINNEIIGVNYTEYIEKMKCLQSGLETIDDGLSNDDAIIYDLIMTQFEENMESKGE